MVYQKHGKLVDGAWSLGGQKRIESRLGGELVGDLILLYWRREAGNKANVFPVVGWGYHVWWNSLARKQLLQALTDLSTVVNLFLGVVALECINLAMLNYFPQNVISCMPQGSCSWALESRQEAAAMLLLAHMVAGHQREADMETAGPVLRSPGPSPSFSDSWTRCMCSVPWGKSPPTNSRGNANWHGFQSVLLGYSLSCWFQNDLYLHNFKSIFPS